MRFYPSVLGRQQGDEASWILTSRGIFFSGNATEATTSPKPCNANVFCPKKLLDLVENFILFVESRRSGRERWSRTTKFLGVEPAVDSVIPQGHWRKIQSTTTRSPVGRFRRSDRPC